MRPHNSASGRFLAAAIGCGKPLPGISGALAAHEQESAPPHLHPWHAEVTAVLREEGAKDAAAVASVSPRVGTARAVAAVKKEPVPQPRIGTARAVAFALRIAEREDAAAVGEGVDPARLRAGGPVAAQYGWVPVRPSWPALPQGRMTPIPGLDDKEGAGHDDDGGRAST